SREQRRPKLFRFDLQPVHRRPLADDGCRRYRWRWRLGFSARLLHPRPNLRAEIPFRYVGERGAVRSCFEKSKGGVSSRPLRIRASFWTAPVPWRFFGGKRGTLFGSSRAKDPLNKAAEDSRSPRRFAQYSSPTMRQPLDCAN